MLGTNSKSKLLVPMVAVALLAVGLGACQRAGLDPFRSSAPARTPSAIRSEPLAPMDLTSRPPAGEPGTPAADGTDPAEGETPAADGTPPPTDGAAPEAPPEAANQEVGRTDLLGGWTLVTGTDSCQLFMSLTTWKGGYRATTKGCSHPSAMVVTSWDLNGKQVQLKDSTGAVVAYLYPTGREKFVGQTRTGGDAMSFSR